MSAQEVMPEGSRVQLKADCVEFYRIGTSSFDGEPVYVVEGSEAFVKAHRVDDEGFDVVLIKWDRDDWRFQGQDDGWAYPAHFKLVARPKPQVEEVEDEVVVRDLVEKAMDEAEKRCPHCGQNHQESDAERERGRYLDILSKAIDSAAGGEGFVLLAVVEDEVDGHAVVAPRLFSAAMTDEAGLLLEAQLADIVANTYRAYALSRLKVTK